MAIDKGWVRTESDYPNTSANRFEYDHPLGPYFEATDLTDTAWRLGGMTRRVFKSREDAERAAIKRTLKLTKQAMDRLHIRYSALIHLLSEID